MRQKVMKAAIIFCLLMGNAILSNAQVTIGNAHKPVPGALLQLKQTTSISDDGANATKGFGLPRVSLSEKNQLFPMFLEDPNDPNSGPSAAYVANKEELDRTHTGLLVFNVTEDVAGGLYAGLNMWTGEEWKAFAVQVGSAIFDPVDCSDITIFGTFIEGTPLTSTNFLTIRLNVTKPGAYTIMATTENGYGFFISGIALDVSVLTINIPAQGTPNNVQTDVLTFSGIELALECEPTIEVLPTVAEYVLVCAGTVVNGAFVRNQPLNTSNTITVMVNVVTLGSFHISTPVTYGISFSASGIFSATGMQSVTLHGSGAPTVHADFPIIIQTNTTGGNDRCETLIPMTLPRLTYAIIGNGVWSWAAQARQNALGSVHNFGPNGTVRILGLDLAWHATTTANAIAQLNNTAQTPPDVILYFAFGASPNAALTSLLSNYVRQGGVLIYGSADNTSSEVQTLMAGIFGVAYGGANVTSQSGGSANDNVHLINNLPHCPIINGPFGNLSLNRYWGDDNAQSGAVIVHQLPAGSVQIASARSTTNTTRNPNHSIIWYNEPFNFVYFGDSTGASINNTSPTSYPSSFSTVATGSLPQGKMYGPSIAERRWVENAALELNAVAWALKRAAISGINQH